MRSACGSSLGHGRRGRLLDMLNPEGISVLAMRVADRVQATIGDGRSPPVLGGDCSIVLGPLLALRRRGRYGLAFIDCPADFLHPDDEPIGEVASLDLALATGRGSTVLSDLEGRRPLLRDEDATAHSPRSSPLVSISPAFRHVR